MKSNKPQWEDTNCFIVLKMQVCSKLGLFFKVLPFPKKKKKRTDKQLNKLNKKINFFEVPACTLHVVVIYAFA